MWIKENNKLKWISQEEYLNTLTKQELIEICLEYYNMLYEE